MKKRILIVIILMMVVLIFWHRVRIQEDLAYKVYLPIVMASPLSLKGVGLNSLYQIDADALGVDWFYNWRVYPLSPDRRFVPMIYNADLRALPDAVDIAQDAGGWILGYNEPDRLDQGAVSPTAGAVAWHEIEAVAVDIKLVSPAPSQHDPGWLWRMVSEHQRMYGYAPRFDAIAWHIYTANPEIMKGYLLARRKEALARGYDVPIWVTEWAGLCTLPDPENGNLVLMTTMIPWMNHHSWVGRYAWFAARIRGDELWGPGWQHCSLINPHMGSLTSLGQLYRRIK